MVISRAMQQSPGCFIFFDVDNLKKINAASEKRSPGSGLLEMPSDGIRYTAEFVLNIYI